jgi:glycosyltransferase involved in cell wall biosynthesis
MEISIVILVYREESNVAEFVRRLIPILEAITPDFEIIFALDPSPDRTEEVILGCRRRDPRVKLLRFSRRIGQPMATLGGLYYSTGQAVIVMDVDLQDPPELIPQLIARWREGFDVVYAQRRNRKGETWLKRVVSGAGYKLINKIADVNIPPNTGDFRLISRRVVEQINALKESHGLLRGMVAAVGFRQTSVPSTGPRVLKALVNTINRLCPPVANAGYNTVARTTSCRFIAHQLRLLHSRGIRQAVLCVAYLGEVIAAELGKRIARLQDTGAHGQRWPTVVGMPCERPRGRGIRKLSTRRE